jgi:hypothetical protein
VRLVITVVQPRIAIVDFVPFDLVLRGGRVIDPAQKLDGVLDAVVRDGRVAAVGQELSGPMHDFGKVLSEPPISREQLFDLRSTLFDFE